MCIARYHQCMPCVQTPLPQWAGLSVANFSTKSILFDHKQYSEAM